MKQSIIRDRLTWIEHELAMLRSGNRDTAQGRKDHNRKSTLYRTRKSLLAKLKPAEKAGDK